MIKKTIVNTSPHPVQLTGGRVLAQGEKAEKIDVGDLYEQRLIENNALRVIEPKATKKSEPKPDTSDEESS